MVFWERDWWSKWWEKQRQRDCCDCECSWTTAIVCLVVLAVLGGALALLVLAFAVLNTPTASADDALLTRFDLAPAPNSTSTARPPLQLLSYNATVTVSLRNPNLHYGVTFGAVAAAFSFNGTRFDESGTVPTLDLGARKEAAVRLRVGAVGRALPKLTAAGAAEFARQKDAGVFEVEVRLDTVMQYKGRKTKCPLGIVCPLRLQLVDPDVAATAFQKTKCTVLRAKISGC
ncbi:uncharacterized protein [Triticum aestivum]|uniref:uncharacterized protein n=1 Tax=Triticum aestivum TaxID=4565 RepID=UPI000842BF03|nr:uncharacterized protein LOC123087754 [Triticum aestivum]